MSIYRAGLAMFAMLFGTLVASAAFAGCGGGCGYAVTYAPAVYAPPPMAFLPPPAPQALVTPAPVAPVPLAPAPIAVDHWDTGGWGCGAWSCSSWGGWSGWGSWGASWGASWRGGWGGGCGCCGGCSGLFIAGFAAVPTPIYVVNQGPDYSGPGVMVPYGTYSPYNGVAGRYPYVGDYAYRHRHQPYPHY